MILLWIRNGAIINPPFLLVFSTSTQMISNRCVEYNYVPINIIWVESETCGLVGWISVAPSDKAMFIYCINVGWRSLSSLQNTYLTHYHHLIRSKNPA